MPEPPPYARLALDVARRVFAASDVSTAPELWRSAQTVLQLVVGRAELSGQALVAEIRRLGLITLTDAHALVELSAWSDRSTGPATTEAERMVVREAWMALEHAVPEAPGQSHATVSAATAPAVAAPQFGPVTGASRSSQQSGQAAHPKSANTPDGMGSEARSSRDHAQSGASSTAYEGTGPGASSEARLQSDERSRTSRRRWPFPLLLGLLAAVTVGIATGVWWLLDARSERDLREAVAAYQRGSRDSARTELARLAMKHPEDARPLVYLARLVREDGDLARARTMLTNAVRIAPRNAVASRELAAVMLADGQPDIARRFYVRALELDPGDPVAQGFLGCALVQLGRFDEARRWLVRAGSGEWQGCLSGISTGERGTAESPNTPGS